MEESFSLACPSLPASPTFNTVSFLTLLPLISRYLDEVVPSQLFPSPRSQRIIIDSPYFSRTNRRFNSISNAENVVLVEISDEDSNRSSDHSDEHSNREKDHDHSEVLVSPDFVEDLPHSSPHRQTQLSSTSKVFSAQKSSLSLSLDPSSSSSPSISEKKRASRPLSSPSLSPTSPRHQKKSRFLSEEKSPSVGDFESISPQLTPVQRSAIHALKKSCKREKELLLAKVFLIFFRFDSYHAV